MKLKKKTESCSNVHRLFPFYNVLSSLTYRLSETAINLILLKIILSFSILFRYKVDCFFLLVFLLLFNSID